MSTTAAATAANTTSFAPGTLFRIYKENNIHFTAVLLKNGKLLEVKNPTNGFKTTPYESLSDWCQHHNTTQEDVKIDGSKASGTVVIQDDAIASGFNYPTEKHPAFTWVRYLYSLVKELAPQLLESEDFKILYNLMVEVCTKHKDELNTTARTSGMGRYVPFRYSYSSGFSTWNGFPGYFHKEYNRGSKNYSREQYNQAREQIVTVYKNIYDMVTPVIGDIMDKKYKVLRSWQAVCSYKKKMTHLQKKISGLQSTIDSYKSAIEKQLDVLNKDEMEKIRAKLATM